MNTTKTPQGLHETQQKIRESILHDLRNRKWLVMFFRQIGSVSSDT